MRAVNRSMMNSQVYCPKSAGPHNTELVRSMGVDTPESTAFRQGRNWIRHQVCRHSTFSLVALESYQTGTEYIGTRLDEYIKSRTPNPIKITFAGENTCQVNIRW